MLPYTLGPSCFSFLPPPPPPLFIAEICFLALSFFSFSFFSSFRPSLPKKRLGIYLIDRFTAPEDILSATYTRHVYIYIYISFFPCILARPILSLEIDKGLPRMTGYIFWETILFREVERLTEGESLLEKNWVNSKEVIVITLV